MSQDFSSSTIRPSRPHSLADKSFFGKFEAALDDYDQLPSLQDDDLCDICDALTSESALNQTQLQPHQPTTTLASDSILNAPEPSHELAKLAEHTRSSLMQRKPAAPASSQSQSRVTFALEPSASSIPEDTTAPAAPNKKKANPASMMTHPPSRTVAVAGGRANPGHTFGSLPRTSPSGTMAHHKAEMPTPTATAALQQKTKARMPHGGAENDMSEANARYAQYKAQPPPSFDKCLPCGDSSTENKRPSSAASSQDSTQQSVQQRQPLSNKPGAFAVDAKGGPLAWRPPSAATKPRERVKPPSRQELKRQEKAFDAADAEVKKGALNPTACGPFAFAAVCCGGEFEGYCCKRHHPSDDVVCCSKHAPLNPLNNKLSGSRLKADSVASRYAALMRDTKIAMSQEM